MEQKLQFRVKGEKSGGSHGSDNASTIEPVQDGRLYIENVNAPFLMAGGSADEYRSGLQVAIANGWLWLHESGTYVRFIQTGAELFA